MINLFHFNYHKINTGDFNHILHGNIVNTVEEKIANFVGAKYGVGINSATNALFLSILNKKKDITIPTMIPPVVCNAVVTSGNNLLFNDDTEWVGDSYVFAKFDNCKIVDSAQKLEKNQFKKECNDNDLMIFSFYPTKPLGGVDGSIIVSNDKDKIEYIRTLAYNGMSQEKNSWDRKQSLPGYKFYLPAINASIINENFKEYDDKLYKLKVVREYYNYKFNLNNSSDHLYRINVKNRNKLIELLKENKVSYGIHYNCQHKTKCFKQDIVLKNSEKESEKTISIPFHEELKLKDQKFIINLVEDYVKV